MRPARADLGVSSGFDPPRAPWACSRLRVFAGRLDTLARAEMRVRGRSRRRTWDPLVLFTDWLFADPRRERIAGWVLIPLGAAVIVAWPWIDERLSPPFGRYWRWDGTQGPSSPRDKLLMGLFTLLFFVVVGSILERYVNFPALSRLRTAITLTTAGAFLVAPLG